MGRDRAASQMRRIGEELQLARAEAGLTHRDLARRAGVATSTVLRLQGGDPDVQVNTLIAVGAAAGIDIALKAYAGRGVKLRDSGQLMVARMLMDLAADRWRPAIEVPAGANGRSADLVFFGPDELLHVEIERFAVDFQAQYRGALAKRDHLASMEARPVRLILCLSDTPRNREAMRPHRELIGRQLPAGSRAVLAALRSGRTLGMDGVLWVRPGRLPGPRAR
jgi:transcriptional regulator with XRE-family HTH domain